MMKRGRDEEHSDHHARQAKSNRPEGSHRYLDKRIVQPGAPWESPIYPILMEDIRKKAVVFHRPRNSSEPFDAQPPIPFKHLEDITRRYQANMFRALEQLDIGKAFAEQGVSGITAFLEDYAIQQRIPSQQTKEQDSNVEQGRRTAASDACGRLRKLLDERNLSTWHKAVKAHDDNKQTKYIMFWDQIVYTMSILDNISRYVFDGSFLRERLKEDAGLIFHADANQWAQLCGSREGAVRHVLGELYARGLLSFPWKCLTLPSPQTFIDNIRTYEAQWDTKENRPHNVHFDSTTLLHLKYDRGNSYLTIYHEDSDYDKMDALMDHFTEHNRLSAKRSDQEKSPLDAWKDPRKIAEEIIPLALRAGCGVEPKQLREALYSTVKECTQFKPSLAAATVRRFNAKRILDFSSGWGDRLAGCIAADVDLYQGFDPNARLRRGHQAIIDTCVPAHKRDRFIITYEPFEKSNLDQYRAPGKQFDLVMTSPPFFDFEIYTTDIRGQSVESHPSRARWMVRFLLYAIRHACSVVKDDGHCIIHITDVFRTRVCEAMLLLALWLVPRASYVGVINSVGKARRSRPMWVLQLRSQTNKLQVHQAEKDLKQFYPEEYKEARALIADEVPGKTL